MASPHAQEIEYALILSRMISLVKEDPSQMRSTIYEFARARLRIDTAWADQTERKRLIDALETAIHGVEAFSARRDEKERLQPPAPPPQIAPPAPSAELPPSSMVAIHQVDPAFRSTVTKITPVSEEVYWEPARPLILEAPTRGLISTLARFCIGMLLFGAVAGLAVYKQGSSLSKTAASTTAPAVAKPAASPAISDPSPQTLAANDARAAASSSALPFPLPSDYGVYAVNGAGLNELYLLPEQVPDKRIAMSTPVNQPSRTTLVDGQAKFVVFRRDFAGNAPERVEVRVVARVVRALSFDAKGKASFTPISDAWNIRNISYEFRVRPIPGNPEMLLVQAEKADFSLPPGRYVLALRSQGYDFTVAGKVTDPSQCLERTDAANGAFYSDCQRN
jgi:hypothetical protein